MGIIPRDGDEEPEDVGTVIEGVKVLNQVVHEVQYDVRLIYCLDLSFPDNLKHTFEFFQKIIMNLN